MNKKIKRSGTSGSNYLKSRIDRDSDTTSMTALGPIFILGRIFLFFFFFFVRKKYMFNAAVKLLCNLIVR